MTAQLSEAELRARLSEVTRWDSRRLRRRFDGLRTARPEVQQRRLTELAADVAAAQRRVERRRAGVPEIRYPEALPVSAAREEIATAIREHRVVIVAGETGSGKTTQLPKICLELGRGIRGTIGHTQPRRLAARTVAERIAEELDVPLGATVGYSVRFTDRVGEDTLVKLMTDGILLAEISRDRLLERYDTLIIDEAHERSLNIDFLLGYVHQLLPRRPDLKVIITSATIEPERFAKHFNDAPIVSVSGRTYPVEVRYRPPEDLSDKDSDRTSAVLAAVEELWTEGSGDILVFLSGEREIRDTADALRQADLPDTEILPLYARLPAAEQHRVFAGHPGRRVVLATNVAETSLTVPGIRYVVDPGTARISRYSLRTKVQRLPIEPISQASARQRAGRCGRVADGICIRLYSEDDYNARPEYTEPEILRTNLASVLLQMTALGLGEIANFPFLDPPDRRSIRDGVALLTELGAFNPAEAGKLTPPGRQLAQLPVDPRLARMVLEADRNGCLAEVLILAAALSIQDPRERPTDHRQAADSQHARFADEHSDFAAYLTLWRYLREQQQELSSNQFRRLCRREYLNYLRVREWQDVHGQLRQVAQGLGFAPAKAGSEPAALDRIHQSLLAGLLSQIGLRDPEKRDYLGARGARFAIAPGSALFRKPPRWVMVAELVETSRLWGRVAARIEPEEAEKLAGHLVKRSYSEPHWEKKRAGVVALEKVTLYGVPLVTGRRIDYGRIDPELCRDLFLRNALVEGDGETHHQFWARNRDLLADVEDLENRVRRHDLLVDDETLMQFYDERIPADVVSGRHFDAWWKKARRTSPDLLDLTLELLLGDGTVSVEDYPDVWVQGDLRLPLSYTFSPGTPQDGVTVDIPLAALDRVDAADFEWQVPGLRHELVTALIRSLPKSLRVALVPAPDRARAVLPLLRPPQARLLEDLSYQLLRQTGVEIPPDAWAPDRVPEHLRMTFRVVDGSRTLAEGKDLPDLRRRLQPQVRALLQDAAVGVERQGLTSWNLGTLPQRIDRGTGVQKIAGYPALVDERTSVAIRVLRTEAEQRGAMWRGTRRLLMLTLPNPLPGVVAQLTNNVKLALVHNPHGSVPALLEDCLASAVDTLLARFGGPVWTEADFATLSGQVRAELRDTFANIVPTVAHILETAHEVEAGLQTLPASDPSAADMRAQLPRLVGPGFVTATGYHRLNDLLRYVRGLRHRLGKYPDDPARDRARLLRVERMQQAYADTLARLPADPAKRASAQILRWQLEELRVSLFAQGLGTPEPVSSERILRALADLLR
ncbi:MAG: ATP-dependent RNA helicase HrpA [Frankiaceae bacterium]